MKRSNLVLLFLAISSALLTVGTAAAGDPTYHYGFVTSTNGAVPSIVEEGFKEILIKHGALFLGDTAKKDIYLTFNNGYENGNTVKVLDVLKEKKVPAAFFITGYYVQYEPELIKRMANEGHMIGNHSWSHPDMSQISTSRLTAELERVKKGVATLTGQTEMRFMRPPSGTFNERVLRVGRELGYTNVFWSIGYRDWDINNQKGWKYAYDTVMGQLHPGAVIMLHAVSDDNTKALGKIIDDARGRGYEFKGLEQLTTKRY